MIRSVVRFSPFSLLPLGEGLGMRALRAYFYILFVLRGRRVAFKESAEPILYIFIFRA